MSLFEGADKPGLNLWVWQQNARRGTEKEEEKGRQESSRATTFTVLNPTLPLDCSVSTPPDTPQTWCQRSVPPRASPRQSGATRNGAAGNASAPQAHT